MPTPDGRRVCLASCRELPGLAADDRLLEAELLRRGWSVEVAAWDAPDVAWEAYRAVVLRSTWDYHRRPHEFLAWLDRCEQRGARLLNPVPLLRWNHHKRYLLELAGDGIEVVPTLLLGAGTTPRLAELLAERGWHAAVVKPAIGATAWQAFRTGIRAAPADQPRLAALLESGDVLVQPFLDEVEAVGELSLLFFGGEFSHAVSKRAAAGEFRVQGDFGGSVASIAPGEALLEQARAVTARVPGPWLYARVDGVERQGRLTLMELELIEPQLFFERASGAAARFAAALEQALAPG